MRKLKELILKWWYNNIDNYNVPEPLKFEEFWKYLNDQIKVS